MKRFVEYFLAQKHTVAEDIFIGQGSQLQSPIPGTQITDSDLSPKEKQNKFKKKNTQRPK